jgi:hypothetical protein
MTDLKLREIMYHLTCPRRASNPCIPSRTEGFAPLQFKALYSTVQVTSRAQVLLRPQTRMQCHSHVWRNMGAIFPHVFSPVTRMQCQNMGNMIMNPMQLPRSPKTTALVRRKSTGSKSVTMGKVIHYFSDFLDPYFYFLLNLN